MFIIKRNTYKKKQSRPMAGSKPVSNETGSALLIALVVLVVLTLIGVIATRTTQTELKISASDKRHRIVFYDADGATELASELLEQNIEELEFDGSVEDYDAENEVYGGLIGIEIPDFWLNVEDLATTPTDTDRDFFLPYDAGADDPHTNFTVGGFPDRVIGSSVVQAAGYEGLGKKAGSAGTMNIFEIITKRVGEDNSESTVRVMWRHINN